jgi:hypothetical protein
MRRPHQLPALFRTALDVRAARATLPLGCPLLEPSHVAAGVRPTRAAEPAAPADPVQADFSSAVS